jgi:hypothetical protein
MRLPGSVPVPPCLGALFTDNVEGGVGHAQPAAGQWMGQAPG